MLQQLSAQDAQFLYSQGNEILLHVMSIHIYDPSTAPDGKVRFKDIIDHFRKRIDISPVFKRKLYRLPFDVDHPYWVEDEHFDLEAHISHARLPEPGDWRQFCIFASRHFNRSMDMNRPLWDVVVVEGLDRIPGLAPGSYGLLIRVHHAAIDGTSAAHMFASLCDSDNKGTPALPQTEKFDLGRVPHPVELVSRAAVANGTSPARFLSTLMKLSPVLVAAGQKSLKDAVAGESQGIPKVRFNAPVTPHKVFDGLEVSFSDLSRIRNLVRGATINDVVLAVVSGGMRRYLEKHGGLPDTTMVALAPINARTRKGEEVNPGNNITAMNVELASDIADPVKRLAAIRAFTSDAKEAKAGISARILADLSKHVPGATLSYASRLATRPRLAPVPANVLVTNVPGPQFPLYMNGAQLVRQYGMAPVTHNMGLSISTFSYMGKMAFGITSDRQIMPDISFFSGCVEESFKELLELARAIPDQVKTAKPAKKGGRRAQGDEGVAP